MNQLLTELDGVEALVGVTVIGATSRPDLVDPGVAAAPGGWTGSCASPFPDREERRAILAAVARDLAVTETGGGGNGVGESKVSEKGGVGKVSDALSMVWDDVAAKTEGFTGADYARSCPTRPCTRCTERSQKCRTRAATVRMTPTPRTCA